MKIWDKLMRITKVIVIISAVLLLTSCKGIIPGVTLEEQGALNNSIIPVVENKAKVSSVYLEVPYQRYAGTNWCLPASGSMTLDYLGLKISQQELAQNIIKPNGLGDIYKMVRFAQNLGFEASFTVLKMEEIEDYLSNNIPLIAIQEYNKSNPLAHARVITGFDSNKKEIVSNDPTLGKNYTMSYEEFMDLNLTANPKYCMAIVIIPGYI